MQLDYGTLLSRSPVRLSIGRLRKPRLKDIAKLGFDKFGYYESLLKMSPELLYSTILGEHGEAYWESLSDDVRDSMTMYRVILTNKQMQESYTEMFDFFFKEKVVFQNGIFLLLRKGTDVDNIEQGSVVGMITEKTFQQVVELIQQVCCIYEKPKPTIEEMSFKNDIAKKMFARMQKSQEKLDRMKARQSSKNFSIPNIISKVSNMHKSINPVNVWDLTIFELIDAFNCLQTNEVYDIDKTRVSVWGDEKKKFDPALWYKNNNDSE